MNELLLHGTSKLRVFHFKGILAVMLAACLIVMGGSFVQLVESFPPL